MNIETFDDLLAAARAEPTPQRLLLVFAGADLGADASAAQRAAHAAGEGGELLPLMCVDKNAQELRDFATLCAEARDAGPPWALVFAAALAGPSTAKQVEAALQRMVDGIKGGDLRGLLPFNAQGEAVRLSA